LIVSFPKLLKLCGVLHHFDHFHKALAMDAGIIVSQGVAFGLEYAKPLAC
jgi:hypothetical protein